MNHKINLINKELSIKDKSQSQNLNKYKIGLQGQDFVELTCKEAGYTTYKKNLKQIGLEIDLIVYKVIQTDRKQNLLIIHIIEVKTRKSSAYTDYMSPSISDFDIAGKWRKVRRVIYDIPCEIKKLIGITCAHKITFDLAVVLRLSNTKEEDAFKIKTYMRNVDLLL